jgi:enamine deaminase RidA (YjgF/YER057c/UK114 family)
MRKQIINPDTGEWAEHDTAYSDGVVLDVPGGKRAFLSGIVAEGDGIGDQTRAILEEIEATLGDLGGGMGDVVRVRVYIARPAMDEESLETVHEIRTEFFDQTQLPASTLVEVEDLVEDHFQIEIDADAFIADDGWDVETI